MLGFVIAVAAGFATPHIEAPLARPVLRALDQHIRFAAGEVRLVAFMLALLAAALLATLLDSGSAVGIVVGAVLGYFATRIVAGGRAAMEARR